jgi:hypothetical protein
MPNNENDESRTLKMVEKCAGLILKRIKITSHDSFIIIDEDK